MTEYKGMRKTKAKQKRKVWKQKKLKRRIRKYKRKEGNGKGEINEHLKNLTHSQDKSANAKRAPFKLKEAKENASHSKSFSRIDQSARARLYQRRIEVLKTKGLDLKRKAVLEQGHYSYPGSSYPTRDVWRQVDRPLQVRITRPLLKEFGPITTEVPPSSGDKGSASSSSPPFRHGGSSHHPQVGHIGANHHSRSHPRSTFSFRRLSIRGSSLSSSSTSLPHSSSNHLTEKVTRPEELSPKHNIFEDINQAIDNWKITKIPQDELYVPNDNKRKSDYIIKIAENNIPLGPDSGEEFHLLTKQSVREHARHYKYLHIGCVQVAVKPLIREGLNASILMCLRDIRLNDFQDSLIGTVETSLGHSPVYFNCFPNKTVSLLDVNILDSLFLNIQIHGLNMKEGSIPAALIYRIQYKVMNTCNSRVFLKSSDRETTLFVTYMTKANVTVPRLIKWDKIYLPQSWSIDQATPTQPRQAPLLREIKQDESGRVEIFFDRRNSFSSRSEAGTSNDFASARKSFCDFTISVFN
ncbi:polyprotein [Arachis hypogaea]|nr:polyprotein [Arachis hypogaea]